MHFIAMPDCARRCIPFCRSERRQVEKWIEVGHQQSQLKAPPASNVEQEPGTEPE